MKRKITFDNLLIEKILFPAADFALGTRFMANLRECRRIQNCNESQLQEIQNRKLATILDHALTKSKFYMNSGIERGGAPHQQLKKFPLLTKSIIRTNEESLLTIPRDKCISYSTSGSSGVATKVFVDKHEESKFRAILINWWEWTGYHLGKPIIQTGMTPGRGLVKSLKDIITRTTYLNAFHLNKHDVLPVLASCGSGYSMGGYASSLYVIAQMAEEAGVRVKFDGVISWGDKMFAHYKEKIERVFETKVFENYASNEGIMIGQKVDLPYFYVYTPNVFLEIVDENGNEVKDGEIGRVVVTKLDGYAMPLIRYEIGDLAVKLPREKYPKQRLFQFPLLERVIGRDTDIIVCKDGTALIVHTFTGIFAKYSQIRQFRVIQMELESITIEYMTGVNFEAFILRTIEEEFYSKTKAPIAINWSEVQSIPSTPSGKPQIVLNSLLPSLKGSYRILN